MTDPNLGAPECPAAAQERRDRRVLWAVVVWLPLAVIAVATAIQLLWIPRLPEEVAVHFGVAGEPDRWTTPTRSVLGYLVLSLAVAASIALATFAGRRAMLRPADGARVRLLAQVRPTAAVAPAVSILIAVVVLVLTGAQLDGAEPAGWTAPVAVGAGILLGVLAGWITWQALPAPDRPEPSAATPALDLAPGERAVWTASATAPWIVFAIIGLAGACLIVPIVMAPSAWWLWGSLLVVVALLATTTGVRVTVDRRGLTARTLLGLRLTQVPLADVVSASDVEVLPGEFGGWGFRYDLRGRRGIIMRGGPGIEVQRRDAAPLVVTVSDARTGAALLNALAAAAR
ncbi:DUF1648 domain-containing protein [Agromyces sp. CFH 90414]|uniref:DUF1648 domain-containing protein n=1 Tax=Agromyces agglutinans TaxID=2662258 RepID=A0A6I2FF51_9MICO|nr:DUF1648 domain-containing protein [Agromyces agglutinans]MRG61176.1 DUF1648 domain-containing protein [Agromyces agglutinans]